MSEGNFEEFRPIDEVDPLSPEDAPTVIKPTGPQEPWIEAKQPPTFDSLMADISEKIDQGLDEPEAILATLDDLEANYAEEFDKHPEYIFSKEQNRDTLRKRCEIIIDNRSNKKAA